MNVCVLLANPNPKSLNHALADALARGAKCAGHEVRLHDLYRMEYETCLRIGSGVAQHLESDLLKAQEDIRWCDHLAVIFPLWCLTTPARLTGFIERALAPISTKRVDGRREKLLTGKSARVFYTADAAHEEIVRDSSDPAWLQVKGMLEWGGFRPIDLKVFDQVGASTLERRRGWLAEMEQIGASLD